METTFDGLAAYEKALKDIMATPAFGAWYQKFMPFVESGYREIFTLLD